MAKNSTTEELPFGPEVLVFKVLSKMYALVSWQSTPLSISLKCNPTEALFLRGLYTAVQPGYHLSKNHWNTVTLDGSIPEKEIYQMIDASYKLVVKGLPKKEQEKLK